MHAEDQQCHLYVIMLSQQNKDSLKGGIDKEQYDSLQKAIIGNILQGRS